jgi:hypothetical protein
MQLLNNLLGINPIISANFTNTSTIKFTGINLFFAIQIQWGTKEVHSQHTFQIPSTQI